MQVGKLLSNFEHRSLRFVSICTKYRSRSLKLFHFTILTYLLTVKIILFFCQILVQCVHRSLLQITQLRERSTNLMGNWGVLILALEFPWLIIKVQSSANLLLTSMKSTWSLLQKSTKSINCQSITCGNIPCMVKWTKPGDGSPFTRFSPHDHILSPCAINYCPPFPYSPPTIYWCGPPVNDSY